MRKECVGSIESLKADRIKVTLDHDTLTTK